MKIEEKIEKKREEIRKSKEKIAAEQAKIAKNQKELDTLESLEVKAMLKEIDMPLDEVRALLKTMKPTPTVDPKEEK